MEEFIGYIIKNLVTKPEQVTVKRTSSENTDVYEVRVAPEDMGKLIGKQGRTINSVRTLVAATSARLDAKKRTLVEVYDEGKERQE
ncbi:MAG: KH domain-containing protein [Chlamydiae bacterium]|jgi:predicted RNA-binding protein YlqC (UPF0109 family)|nr:KH domain-containing protein [Chlamydiota bacterium]MBM3197025.1 KH domain-containing protein [Chlamydiota bacterium]MBU6149043.1 KH domain-containing protein [Verrucomicrobiota bacterium]NDE62988.1 KH domain-containing protein [Chlamydiota bacterium]